jgi:hypothetical protein
MQLYHHLFPEKARIVQCYYSPVVPVQLWRHEAARHGQSLISHGIAAFYPRVHVCVPPGIHFALLLLLVVLGWRPLIKLGNISADS